MRGCCLGCSKNPTAGENSTVGASAESLCKLPNQSDADGSTVATLPCEKVAATGEGDNTKEMADIGQDEYKAVRHRKRKTAGIRVLLSPLEQRQDLRRENPVALFSAVLLLLGKAPNHSRFADQGAYYFA